ncbi:hypothetical protein [Flavihumibacter sp. CACIAM 22H1]|uniref:hypothetical protein n=1 Tax=Flavihumibacter sp. CACIAM 22H1 TaxID=1812911 RepID=UPI0007A8CBC5|nr:hypothetical protein [Flavihumibacter sp. CACIAM 22H1]KYP13161.1 MAG: hypothetical protein A1D16_07155 [Flavihumibacter sp. CACIAM 22H1]
MQIYQAGAERKSEGFFKYASLPGYQEQEYQLVWALPEVVKDKIRRQRQLFQEKYPLPFAVPAQVVLPLVKFRQRQLLEERVKQSIYQLATGWRPFQIRLQDYAAQPTHSLFIPVASRAGANAETGLWGISRELKSIQHLLRPDKEHPAFFPTEHKILLAGKLPSALFEQAWREYANKSFTAQFLADACLLLKRTQGSSNWQIIQRIELRNLPVGVRQQSLFDA